MLLSTHALSAQSPPENLELFSTDGSVQILSPSRLAELPQTTLTVRDGAVTSTFTGPSLRDLLSLAGAPAGRALRGPAMAIVVLAEAADGYTVAFTVSELDPQFGNRTAIVALRQDGADGDLRIVLPDDAFHARWVRQLARLRLVQMPNHTAESTHR